MIKESWPPPPDSLDKILRPFTQTRKTRQNYKQCPRALSFEPVLKIERKQRAKTERKKEDEINISRF